ncbi:MAG: RDD family protein, partial [Planctomycetota bacterium]|nr:RDD family protein [Planctomycetota bacterium]
MDNQSFDPYSTPESSVERAGPSKVDQLVLVGFGPRLLAYFLDAVLALAVYVGVIVIAVFLFGVEWLDEEPEVIAAWLDFHALLINAVFYIVPAVVYVGFWSLAGATPGKIMVGIKIVNMRTGETPSVGKCLLRYVGYFFSYIILCLGFFWMIWDKRRMG